MIFLILVGAAVMLIGGIWLLVIMFQTSLPWGIIGILIPVTSLIFVAMHWEESRRPFLIQVAGVILYVAGMSLAGDQPAAGVR
jgi:hypothetical protein